MVKRSGLPYWRFLHKEATASLPWAKRDQEVWGLGNVGRPNMKHSHRARTFTEGIPSVKVRAEKKLSSPGKGADEENC